MYLYKNEVVSWNGGYGTAYSGPNMISKKTLLSHPVLCPNLFQDILVLAEWEFCQ